MDVAHFFSWFALLALLPLAAARLAARRFEHPLAHLNRVAGPAIVCVVWLHGVLFDPPNNWAALVPGAFRSYAPDGTLLSTSPGMGFFEFWFKPFRAMDWNEERTEAALWLATPALVLLGVAGMTAVLRARRASAGELASAIAYACWVLAGLVLRHIPDRVMDVPDIYFGARFERAAPPLGVLVIAAPLLLAAATLTFRVRETSPRRK